MMTLDRLITEFFPDGMEFALLGKIGVGNASVK
jgi:hypothetical protein